MNRTLLFQAAVFFLITLNAIDATSTAIGLSIGVLQEQNPVMRAAWNLHPSAFFAVKFLLMGWAMSRLLVTPKRFAVPVLATLNAAYLVIIAIQVQGWIQIVKLLKGAA